MRYQVGLRKLNLFLFAFVCSTFFIPNILYASVFYVATTGADSNSGTSISPFKTIKKGVTALSAGDTLYVKAGTYAESILSWETPVPKGTSWDNPVTIAAVPGETVTIKAPSGTAAFWIKDPTVKYLIIDGFVMDGEKGALHGVKLSGPTHIRVQNSEIKNSVYSGFLITCNGCGTATLNTYHEFINLNVHHNGSSIKDHGFYIQTSHNLVERCDTHHNSATGGKFYNGYFEPGASASTAANYNIIRYSTTHDNAQKPCYPDDPTRCASPSGWIVSSGEGNQAYGNVSYNNPRGFTIGHGAKNALMYNNIAYNNSDYGIYIHGAFGGSTSARVFNNTVYNNGQYGISVELDASHTIIKNNIAFKNGPAASRNIWLEPDKSPGTVSSNNFIADPGFMEVSALNFKLQPGSPAIDAGLTIPEVTIDFFGVKRGLGKAYDIGAIEYEMIKDVSAPETPKNLRVLN